VHTNYGIKVQPNGGKLQVECLKFDERLRLAYGQGQWSFLSRPTD